MNGRNAMVDHYVLESSLPSSYFVVGLEMAAAESYVSRGFSANRSRR